MEIGISRFWSCDNNAELLYKRPRVDYRISEYLFSIINQKILTDKKVMQSGNYSITLFMTLFDSEKHKFFFENPYDTDKTKFNFPENRSFTSKTVYIFCNSLLFDSQMTPSEYARIVYDMYAFYFIHRYKRLTKALFDEMKKQLDYGFINSFEFPAPFENQKYSLDESSIEVNPKYDKDRRQWIGEFTFVPKDEYIKVFGK